MGAINPQFNSTGQPPNGKPSSGLNQHLQVAQNVATVAGQVAQAKAEEAQKSAVDKFASGSKQLGQGLMFDESAENLNTPEKAIAFASGIGGLVVAQGAINALAGQDPFLGVITAENRAAAKNSPIGKLARIIDQASPAWAKEGALKGLPDWFRAMAGVMPEDEYYRYYLKNHMVGMNATYNKLRKSDPIAGNLLDHYYGHFDHLNEVLKDPTKTLGAFGDHALKTAGQTLLQPYIKENGHNFVQNPVLRSHAEALFNMHRQQYLSAQGVLDVLKKEYTAVKKSKPESHPDVVQAASKFYNQQNTVERYLNLFRVEDPNWAKDQAKRFNVATDKTRFDEVLNFNDFSKKQPHRLMEHLKFAQQNAGKNTGAAAEQINGHLNGLYRGVLEDAQKKNANTVQELLMEHQFHHQMVTGMFDRNKTGKFDIKSGLLPTKDSKHTIIEAQEAFSTLHDIGRKKWAIMPGGRWLSQVTAGGSSEASTLKAASIKHIEASRTVMSPILSEAHVNRALDALKKAKTVTDVMKANESFSKEGGQVLNDFANLQRVLPGGVKRLMQNLSDHKQFVTQQKALSNAWEVEGFGRVVASMWRAVGDYAEFRVHLGPKEMYNNMMASAGTESQIKGGALQKTVARFGKSVANPGRLGYYAGAAIAFSSAAAAWMAAGKNPDVQKYKRIHPHEKKLPQAQQQKQDNYNAPLGERPKSALRSMVSMAVPMVLGGSIATFLNRGNQLGRLLGGHYLTTFTVLPKVHWLTAAGAVIGIGGQLVLGEVLRKPMARGLDKVFGKPAFVDEREERERAQTDIGHISSRQFDKLKKDSVVNIMKHPDAFMKTKETLTDAQLAEAHRLAGLKDAPKIQAKEAALFYTLAQQQGLPIKPAQLPQIPQVEPKHKHS